ncbi:hypothetical protein [Alloalcanivorax marinus]|uniref:hypothetical protein n=1 Tax=Alloalcanivorax marinus TaxID=1177169 RepID=UPI0021D01CCB|nr:hypothetical protein [Alloalcanivorax marinus]MCU5785939.1 hypothetical protein [Alloalcanivorax marinus]
MMPAAIYYSFTGEGVRYHFESPNRFVTPGEALALGLVNDEELAKLRRIAAENGWEDDHGTP